MALLATFSLGTLSESLGAQCPSLCKKASRFTQANTVSLAHRTKKTSSKELVLSYLIYNRLFGD